MCDADDSADDYFEIGLVFSVAQCPGCSTYQEPGPCPECGAEVPAVDDVHELAQARQRGLGPLVQEARDLRAAFEDLPDARIRISSGQFASAVSDADLFGLLGEMPGLGNRLSGMGLNDPKAIGGPVRIAIRQHLDVVAQLLDACRDLASFEPAGPAAELREVAVEAGTWGASVLIHLLDAVIAGTVTAARASQAELQRLLDEHPVSGNRLDPLFARLTEWIVPDVDERVSLALQRPGRYSDDFDSLDVARVFGAFAEDESPMERIGERARDFLGHLLRARSEHTPGSDAMLVLPAAAIASLDRPLHAHRNAWLLRDLADEAWARDPDAVRALIERTTQQGPLVFAASARIERGLRLLAMQDQAGLIADDDVVTAIMRTYLDASEAAFRTLAWFVLDLDRVASGEPPLADAHAPTLGVVEQQLAASDHRVGEALARCSDSALRNASGHAQYRWDSGTETLLHLRDDHRWTLEELEDRMHALAAGIVGAEVGYSAFLVDREIDLEPPTWLRTGQAPAAAKLFAQACLGAYGYVVEAVNDDASEIVLSDDHANPVRLLPALAGLAATTITAPRIRVLRRDGSSLFEVETAAFAAARDVPDEVKDLAVLAPILSAAKYGGEDEAAALRRVVAVQIVVVVSTAVPVLAAGTEGPEVLPALARRLEYVRSFIRAHDHGGHVPGRVVEHLSRARAAAAMARRGDHAPRRRLGQHLAALIAWAGQQDPRWPPL